MAMALLPDPATEIAIPVCAIIGFAYCLFLGFFSKCPPAPRFDEEAYDLEYWTHCQRITRAISEGVDAFLLRGYPYVKVFLVVYAILIFLCLGSVGGYSTQSRPCRFDPSKMCKPALATAVVSSISFLLGSFTSMFFGSLGMRNAVKANLRTALAARPRWGWDIGKKFIATFMSGAAMGFLLAAVCLLLLYIAISLFKLYYGNDWEGLFEAIAAYGLGGSFIAFFGRAYGGIYAEAANFSVIDAVKRWSELPRDERNSAVSVIPDHVGDIVGDIAGTWTDLFGSCAVSSCAVLVVASISSFGIDHNFTAICYPLLICAMGILVCFITTLIKPKPREIEEWLGVKTKLEKQLMISTMLMTVGIFIVSWIALPSSFTIYHFGSQNVVKNWQLVPCVGVGLWGGLATGFVNKLYTDDAWRYIHDAIAAIPIFGLSLVKIPICAAISVCVSYSFAGFYGVALAAVGMLSTVATRLAINAYGPMSHSAHRIVNADDDSGPDFAGDTAVAIAKGFALESAALVSVALLGAFVSRAAIPPVAVGTPKAFIGLIVGVVLPYLFYYMTINRVGSPAVEMAKEVSQVREVRLNPSRRSEDIEPVKPISVCTRASIRAITGPVALAMFAPLMIGTLFGMETVPGILLGSLASVVRIAISGSTDEGRRKERKYIAESLWKAAWTLPPELSGRIIDQHKRRSNPKDVTGPLLNNLIQVMAVQMLVFAPFLAIHGDLLSNNFGGWERATSLS